MVFKSKLFFSSSKKSDSSSPDGSSNSPRLFGSSNSPIRFDKKKSKSSSKDDAVQTTPISSFTCRQAQVKDGLKKKEIKGKETLQTQTHKLTATKATTTPSKPGLFSASKSTKGGGVDSTKKEVPSSVSPILASSLGLNRIKTRSGPLPQESFFSFNRGDGNKASSAAASNLSRPGGGGIDGNSSSGKSGSSGKKEVVNKMGFLGGVICDNGSTFDNMSIGSGGKSREQSPNVPGTSLLRTGESSSETGT